MAKKHRFNSQKFLVERGEKLRLGKRSTRAGKELSGKAQAVEALAADVSRLQEAQRVLYASGSHSLLVIFQGMDAAGKDGTIRHVMGGVNPQGCRVHSFKAPNDTELKHHFLWRPSPCLPERGMIGLFNRSYYEEVLVVRVHPEFLVPQQIPGIEISKARTLSRLWKQRYREIRAFEQTLANSGTKILKFYLHVSQDEQRDRFLERLTKPEKYWKFNAADLTERKLWPEYQEVFEAALTETSTEDCPWFVIPADDKWYARAAVADIITAELESLDLSYPSVDPEESRHFAELAEQLRKE